MIVGLVLAGNLISLAGITDPNPLGPVSEIGQYTPGFEVGHSTLDPNIGFTAQALGHRAMLDLLHGHLPWWNPYEATGMPLAGEMQSGALFPPNILLLLSGGQLYQRILLEALAGIWTYLLLKRLGLSFSACLAGGAAFALNGTFAWLQNAAFNPVAFLPLALLGLERARAASLEGRPGGYGVLALAGALSVYAGFPETTYLDTLMVVVWCGSRLAGGGLTRAQRRAFARKAATGFAAAALLAAPLLIAFIDFSARANLGPNGGSFTSVHLPSQAIAQLLLPYVYGPLVAFADPAGILTVSWGVGGYATVLLFLLAAWGLLGRRLRSLRLVLAAWCVLVFARSYGQIPLLGHPLAWLPGMTHVIFYRYSTPMLELTVIILAALGIDDVIKARRRLPIAGVAIGCAAVLAVVWVATEAFRLSIAPGNGDAKFATPSILWAAGTVLAAALAALVIRSPRSRGALLVYVVATNALAMFVVPELSGPKSVRIDLAPVRYLDRHLGNGRFYTLGPLAPNYGSYFGLASVNLNDTPIPSNFSAYETVHLDQAAPAAIFTGTFGGPPGTPTSPVSELFLNLAGYRAAGVRYVLAPPHDAMPARQTALTLVDTTPTTWIYRLSGAAPLFGTPHADCRVAALSGTSATATCPVAATLLYRETWFPGWSATVDGASVTDHGGALFQTIRIPAGRHRISFAYRPPEIVWGEVAFLLGFVSVALAAYRLARPRAAPSHT